MDRAAVLRASIRRAEEELARLDAVPDPALMPDGTALRWDRTYPADAWAPGHRAGRAGDPFAEPRVYTFVALKKAGRWYATARDTDPMSDADLRDVLAEPAVSGIQAATWGPVGPPAIEPAPPAES